MAQRFSLKASAAENVRLMIGGYGYWNMTNSFFWAWEWPCKWFGRQSQPIGAAKAQDDRKCCFQNLRFYLKTMIGHFSQLRWGAILLSRL
jgi:hypothetical protein